MILEYIRPGQYKITKDGENLGVLKRYYLHRVTRRPLTDNEVMRGCVQPGDMWSDGYILNWLNGKTEYFRNIPNLGEQYTFDNYPGPRNVLRPNKNTKYLINTKNIEKNTENV